MTTPHLMRSWLFVLGLLFSTLVSANPIESILAEEHAPAGVVFEIVEGEDDALTWAIPMVQKYISALRNRFPSLPIAVVSHGYEQFLLQTENQSAYQPLHNQVQDLVGSQDVPVHICATHASWYDVTNDDFPDYVDAAPSGPAQINAYKAIGYQLVKVTDAD